MAIKRITPTKQIMQHMDNELAAFERVIIRRLQYMGEKCIVQARDHGSYQDQTGNLRSSVGYVIVRNGAILSGSNFDTVKGGSEGQSEGRSFAQELASKFTKGIALIVVAGMEYASYVEAKGYDVLTSSEMLAEREVPKLLSKLGLDKR